MACTGTDVATAGEIFAGLRYVVPSREVQRPRRSRLGNVERKRRSGRRESEREEDDERVWCLGSLSAVGGGWKEAIVRETEMRI